MLLRFPWRQSSNDDVDDDDDDDDIWLGAIAATSSVLDSLLVLPPMLNFLRRSRSGLELQNLLAICCCRMASLK